LADAEGEPAGAAAPAVRGAVWPCAAGTQDVAAASSAAGSSRLVIVLVVTRPRPAASEAAVLNAGWSPSG
jgi:hypothetical protein